MRRAHAVRTVRYVCSDQNTLSHTGCYGCNVPLAPGCRLVGWMELIREHTVKRLREPHLRARTQLNAANAGERLLRRDSRLHDLSDLFDECVWVNWLVENRAPLHF